MANVDKKLIEQVNKRIIEDEKHIQEIRECVEVKTQMWAKQMIRQIASDHGFTLSDEQFKQAVQDVLEYIDEHPHSATIVIHEM